MLERLFITVSFAALLGVTPAIGQEQTQQPIIKPPAGTEQGVDKTKPKSGDNQAQDDKSGMGKDQATPPDQQAEDSGAAGNQKLKKKKVQQSGEETGDQQQTGDNQATGTKKKNKNAKQGQNSDEMTTGSTGKADTKITAEERTTIRKKIVTHKVTRIDRDRIDFDISIGVAVPRTIHLYTLPPDVVVLVPGYRGYRYFILADGTIVIVEPHTFRIVYVLTA